MPEDKYPKMTDVFQTGGVRNPALWIPEADERALRNLRDTYFAYLRRQRTNTMAARPAATQEERELQQLLVKSMTKDIPDLDARIARINQVHKDRTKGIGDPDPFPFDPQIPPLDPHPQAGEGEFWWANTEWYTSSDNISGAYQTDGLHLFGSIPYSNDSLWAGNFGAVANFFLNPVRRPASSMFRYRSSPHVELFGPVTGSTWFNWLLDQDDNWCKCWLHLRQTAMQLTPAPVILGSLVETRTLLFEENAGRWVGATLPGFVPMPKLDFALADPKLDIVIQLEVKFDIQLEGLASIGFGAENNLANSVLLRTFQWKVEPL